MKICELPIKTFYEKMYLAQNYDNIFEKFEIAKNKKLKIQFFQELIQELKAKKEDDKYIEQLQTESIFFINDFAVGRAGQFGQSGSFLCIYTANPFVALGR